MDFTAALGLGRAGSCRPTTSCTFPSLGSGSLDPSDLTSLAGSHIFLPPTGSNRKRDHRSVRVKRPDYKVAYVQLVSAAGQQGPGNRRRCDRQ